MGVVRLFVGGQTSDLSCFAPAVFCRCPTLTQFTAGKVLIRDGQIVWACVSSKRIWCVCMFVLTYVRAFERIMGISYESGANMFFNICCFIYLARRLKLASVHALG